ncbi:hypothetical protein BGZ60DRAFT_147575 [Tricladium varicosporioides]|nr:hypothetical protein BGZ60DRAFT_147575 [Hymenoscyphus varicosporioides]
MGVYREGNWSFQIKLGWSFFFVWERQKFSLRRERNSFAGVNIYTFAQPLMGVAESCFQFQLSGPLYRYLEIPDFCIVAMLHFPVPKNTIKIPKRSRSSLYHHYHDPKKPQERRPASQVITSFTRSLNIMVANGHLHTNRIVLGFHYSCRMIR